MTMSYPDPGLEAELAYRREQLRGSARRAGRRHWMLGRHRDS
jgi:hypothetical protein